MTDKPSEQSSPTNFFAVVERITEGGLARIILSKPVQEALGKLLGCGADVVCAYLQRISTGVKDETSARSRVVDALAEAAAKSAMEDSSLVARGVTRWAGKLAEQQDTLEKIARRVIFLLAETGIPKTASAPSDDFMSMFENVAQTIKSEEMIDLLARILAGNIRKPTSVSRRALQIMMVLDEDLISSMSFLYPYMVHYPDTIDHFLVDRSKFEFRQMANTLFFTQQYQCHSHDGRRTNQRRYSKGAYNTLWQARIASSHQEI